MRQFWAMTIIIPMLMWYVLFGVLDRNYDMKQKDVENIIYTYTQIAVKKGELYKTVYDEMCKKLNRYGSYEVYITAERYTDAPTDPTKLEGYTVIDTGLREQGYDLLTISVIYDKPDPITAMYNMTSLMTPRANAYDFRLAGTSSMYIQ